MLYHVPEEAFSFSIAAQPYDAGDGAKQLRELHQQLAKAKDKGPGLKKVEELFLNTDFRLVGADRKILPACSMTSRSGEVQTRRTQSPSIC